MHTLASALQAGYSLNSEWYSMPHDMPGRIGENRVRNSAVCPSGGSVCSLADSSVAWEFGTGVDNAHAWTAGYTTGLAMAVWVGDRAGGPIRLPDGSAIVGAGLPATIYRDVMTAAPSTMGLQTSPFAPPVFGGDVNPPGSGVP